MNEEAMLTGDSADRGHIVRAANTCTTDAGDDAGRQQAGGEIALDRDPQRFDIHAAQLPLGGNADQILLADAGDPDRPVDGSMDLIRGVNTQDSTAGEALEVAIPGKRAFAHGQYRRQRGG
jgi:hypothetical protein